MSSIKLTVFIKFGTISYIGYDATNRVLDPNYKISKCFNFIENDILNLNNIFMIIVQKDRFGFYSLISKTQDFDNQDLLRETMFYFITSKSKPLRTKSSIFIDTLS